MQQRYMATREGTPTFIPNEPNTPPNAPMNVLRPCILLALLATAFLNVHAQEGGAQRRREGGVYFAYPYDSTYCETPPPDGYVPVYVSHFGRHGSRWLPSDSRYTQVLAQFADTTLLTQQGLDVRRRLLAVWANAQGHGGQLTPVGERQQRAIALRMAHRLSTLLRGGRRVEARSSVVSRCRQSMEAFLAAWADEGVDVQVEALSDTADMAWIAYTSPDVEALEQNTVVPCAVSPDRLIRSLFRDPSRVEAPEDLMSELHTIAADMQDVDIDVCLDDVLTDEESHALYQRNNRRMWICNGLTPLNQHAAQASAASLWIDLRDHADYALAAYAPDVPNPTAQNRPAARLRFGHDTSLYRLLTLMGVGEGDLIRPDVPDAMDRVVPMAANLQMVFYRHTLTGDILVKVLLHEREQTLPLPDAPTAPYYPWQAVKALVNSRL